MEITPLEQEIVKQHLVDIRAAQSKKSGPDKALPPGLTKKVARGEKLPARLAEKLPAVKSCRKRCMLRRSHCLKSSYGTASATSRNDSGDP